MMVNLELQTLTVNLTPILWAGQEEELKPPGEAQQNSLLILSERKYKGCSEFVTRYT